MSTTRNPDNESLLQSSTIFLRNYFRQEATFKIGRDEHGTTEYMHKKVKSEIEKLKQKHEISIERLDRTKEAIKKQERHQDQDPDTNNTDGNKNSSKRIKRSLSFYQAKQDFYVNKLQAIGEDIQQLKMAKIALERALGKY